MCAYNYSPMTDVFVLGLTAAIFVIPLSVCILKEKFYPQNVVAILFGFAGVCLIFKHSLGFFRLGTIFALLGAIISALNQVIIKRLSTTDSELTIIFYHHLFLMILSFFVGFDSFETISYAHIFFLFVGGVIGAAAQYLIIHAFKLSTSSGLASAVYFMLIPNTLLDFFVYNKIPDIYITEGLILILIGGMRAFTLQSQMK
jgi:drug/metabolite transporter (DMT)-like permease